MTHLKDSKHWVTSKTLQGISGLISLVLISFLGVDISLDEISGLVYGIAGVAFGLYALYGRIVASKTLTVK